MVTPPAWNTITGGTWHGMPDRKTAINWVIDNQLSRRNLDPFEVSILRGKKYLLEKQSHGGVRKASCKNCNLKTQDKISQETGVSPRTIIYDAQLAQAVEDLKKVIKMITLKLTKK